MKSSLILLLSVLMFACSRPPQQAINSPASNDRPMRSEQMTAHTTENQTPRPANSNSGRWTQSGDPIDTTKLDAAVADAEKNVKAKPSDASAKKALAEAYFERAVALTGARQYASALGDYRRTIKLDPDNTEAKKWIEQIVGIYTMMRKEAPKEGEEPPPLPIEKKV